MAPPPDPHSEVSNTCSPTAGEVRALAERVAASEPFQKSPRLRELFQYLCEQAAAGHRGAISEHQIGVEVFGRPGGYDTGADTIVRVQVSQLRRKLEHYFFTEGQHEPVVVEIPRGSYAPVFRHRDRAAAEPAAEPPQKPERRLLRPLIWVGGAAVIALCVWLLIPASESNPARVRTPYLDQFWKAFQNSRPTQVVISDANLIILGDLMKHTATLHEYRSANYPRALLEAHIADPSVRALAERIAETHMTGLQDANVARTMTSLGDRYRFATTLLSARDFRVPQDDNLVLLGHAKGNPWVELFEDKMTFGYEFDYASRRGRIINRAPLGGEQRSYSAEFGTTGYCVVARLPKPVDEGIALVIFGSDMSSLEAGGRFVSDEKPMRQLFTRLGVSSNGRLPYFEVLLRTRLLMNVAPGFEIISHRLPKI